VALCAVVRPSGSAGEASVPRDGCVCACGVCRVNEWSAAEETSAALTVAALVPTLCEIVWPTGTCVPPLPEHPVMARGRTSLAHRSIARRALTYRKISHQPPPPHRVGVAVCVMQTIQYSL